MSNFSNFAMGALTGLLCAGAALWLAPVAAQQQATVPDFTLDRDAAWLMVGDELLRRQRPARSLSINAIPTWTMAPPRPSRNRPSVADHQPDLQPWVVERLRKTNEWVLAGKYRSGRERCYPSGVPAWVVYTLAEPIVMLQTAKEVTMVNLAFSRCATST
jgi:hypothetical protein